MLTLPIKKKWFDMIKSGDKKEEYREIKPYYDSRFKKLDIEYDPEENCMVEEYRIESHRRIIFRNGYSKNSPSILCNCYIFIGKGKPEWGAEKDKLYYVLKILSVEGMKKWHF